MRAQAILLIAFAAISYCSCQPPTHHDYGLDQGNTYANDSVAASKCIAIAPRDTHSVVRTRKRHARGGEISLSPPSRPPPNSTTNTNITLFPQPPSSKTSSWISFFERIITPVFRTIILVLTLFNVNITWRIHAFHFRRRPVRHRDQPALRAWPV